MLPPGAEGEGTVAGDESGGCGSPRGSSRGNSARTAPRNIQFIGACGTAACTSVVLCAVIVVKNCAVQCS